MTKHESPAFRMKVENCRLVPSAAWDQERLATFLNGSIVNVQITQQKNRKLERKYWAILGKVIDHCPVKQKTSEDLHRAIRLKLGVVDAFFTVDGKLRVDVKSTTGMQDPEYRQFFDDAMKLLHEVTGVDPETLRLEAADVGEDETTEPASPSPGDVLEGSGIDAPIDPAADLSGDKPDAGDGYIEAGHDGAASSSSAIDLSEADLAWLKLVTHMLWAATGVNEIDVLKNQMLGIRDNETPPEISRAARDRFNSIFKRCKSVCFGEADAAAVLVEIAAIAGVETREVVS